MILSAIAAMARNRVIGRNNDLPWSLPEDMKFFRDTTKGSVMIMGRKTFESFGKPLPGRFHIVISRSSGPAADSDVASKDKVAWVKTLDEAIALAKTLTPPYPNEVFVVGGGEIYKAAMNVIDRLYLTVIEQDFDGDTKFPEFDESLLKLSAKQNRTEPFPFSFRIYERHR